MDQASRLHLALVKMVAPLRIALVVDPITALIGGGRHPVELSSALCARGHDVRVFGLPPDWLGLAAHPNDARVERRLGPSVMSFEPDGIVAYDGRSPAAWLSARVARRRCIPLVLVEADGWSERSALQRTLWSIGESLWGHLVRRAAGAVVALDSASRSASLARGFAADRIDIVPTGIDLDRYRPGLASDTLVRRRICGRILSCRLPRQVQPAHELLIDVFAGTVGRRDDWSLVFLADGPVAPEMRASAERSGSGARVHFIEFDDAELPALISSSTLHAAPVDGRRVSLDLERALACGVPVLAVDSPRAAAWIRPDEHGLLAPQNDRDAWTAILRVAASSPERRKRWGRAARRMAEEHFGWDVVAARFEHTLDAREQRSLAGGGHLPVRAVQT